MKKIKLIATVSILVGVSFIAGFKTCTLVISRVIKELGEVKHNG